MKRNLFSFPRSQMVGKMLRAMSFVVAVFWATTAMADIVVKGVVADDSEQARPVCWNIRA